MKRKRAGASRNLAMRYRIGCAAQCQVAPIIGTVAESPAAAAEAAEVDLRVVNNRASRKVVLRNADVMIERKADR